jgi:hypothetical protein
MSRHAELLLAGGLVPLGADPGVDMPLEPVRARRYRHPALADRPVVRLVGETAAPGEDGALGFLGFEPSAATEPLARALRRGLGFPQWVLVNDPGRAADALAVVGEMERIARLARARPGTAKERFQTLVRRLPRAHLPSFWEQAGRVFLAAGQRRYAAIAFEKARGAERVYDLPVDGAAHREAFLEFAVAGALAVRSVAGYAEELRRRGPAGEALGRFRELALRRAAGGLPPWTDLPAQVGDLAAAAGRDRGAEDQRLLGELLAVPATRLAPAGFWRRSRAALVRMGRTSAAARRMLLDLFPAPAGHGADGFDGWWLDLLHDAGALDALVLPAGEVPAEAASAWDPAGWVSRFLQHLGRGWWWDRTCPPQLFRLLDRMAPRLRAEGRPVVLPTSRWHGAFDPNVADACLEHGIPLADPSPAATIDLEAWLRAANDQVRRPLAHLARDPRFRPLLAAAIPAFCDRAGLLVDALPATAPLEGVLRSWLEEQAAAVGQGGLLQAAGTLGTLARSAGRQTLARFPSAHAALAATDVGAPLARTLRAGLLDELGWRALEEAVAELDPPWWSASWPVLVVWNGDKAVAVGPSGRVGEHTFRIPTGRDHAPTVLYAGGQFLVCWSELGKQHAYWSAAPQERSAVRDAAPWWHAHGCPCGFAFLLPDGGRLAGRRALYPGDPVPPRASAHLLWDGRTFWAAERERHRPILRELDPRTGERGRRSLPSVLEDRATPGETLHVELCSLAPLPDGLAGTPLGQGGGLVGFRVAARDRDGRPVLRVHGVDGCGLEAPAAASDPVALVALPGAGVPRLLAGEGPLALWDRDLPGPLARVGVGHGGAGPRAFAASLPAEGTPFVPPPAFWHCLQPRDDRGSRALRGVDDEVAGELLHAALADLKGRVTVPPERMPQTAAAVARLLPEVSHPRLLHGLLGTVRTAAELQRRVGQLTARPAAAHERTPPSPRGGPSLDDEVLVAALAGLDGGGEVTYRSHQVHQAAATTVAAQLHLVGRFFAGEVEADAVAPALRAPAFPWPVLLGRIGAVAFQAVGPQLRQRERDALLGLLELWADLPFAADPGAFRVGRASGKVVTAARGERGAYVVLADGPSWMVAGGTHADGTFVERRDDERDAAVLPAEASITRSRRVEPGWGTPAQLAAFVRLARERGPLPWQPAVPEALAARTGLTRAEATLLWAGLPGLDSWDTDFLGPELRGLLGLKLVEAKVARDALRRVGHERRRRLLHAAMPDDPADLWAPLGGGVDDPHSPVARLAAAWVSMFGRCVRPSEDAVVEAEALGLYTPAGELLAPLLEPRAVPALVRDHDCWIETADYHPAVASGRGGEAALAGLTRDLAVAIPWAFASRPVGDPLRARLPELLALIRDRLRHPGLLMEAANCGVEEPGEVARRLFGPVPYRGRGGAALHGQTADDGLTVAVATRWSLALFFRPAMLGDDARSRRLRAQLVGSWERGAVTAVDLLRGRGYAAMATRVRDTPVPEGGYEANPALSAPVVVAAAAGALGLDEDAAALYLQLLALPEPTDRNLRGWNAWTPARHRCAAGRLLAAGLVVQARRPRARRRLFLPGEWVEAAAPNLPLEVWKLPLHRIVQDPAGGRPRGPLPRFLPLVPPHELFTTAWDRVRGGDRPGGAG